MPTQKYFKPRRLMNQLMELRVTDIKLKIVRGRTSPAEQRFQYSTLIEYSVARGDEEILLVMGVIPPTFFYLKEVILL